VSKAIIVAIATVTSLCAYAHTDKPKENLAATAQDVVSATCAFPDTTFADDLVVLGAAALEGRKLDFQIDQRSARTVSQIDVVVNHTSAPVALMLGASNPTIWNISWTEGTKIAAVFVNGYHRQRVAGLKNATPLLISTYEDKGPCEKSTFSYKTFGGSESFLAIFNYGLITKPAEARKEQKLSQVLFSQPITGIFPVNEKSGSVLIGKPIETGQELVTSPTTTPASFHNKREPLAGQAGLEDAVKKRVLRRANLDDAANWINALKKKYALQNRPPPNIPPDLNNAFVVLKKFTYPGGLYGGHSATFYIPQGVPLPSGDYGHSRVYDLNSISLECTAGSACGQSMMRDEIGAGSTQQYMTIEGAQPAADESTACNIQAVPEEAIREPQIGGAVTVYYPNPRTLPADYSGCLNSWIVVGEKTTPAFVAKFDKGVIQFWKAAAMNITCSYEGGQLVHAKSTNASMCPPAREITLKKWQ